jgi:C4-dicarboxylate transporter DctQ subunit
MVQFLRSGELPHHDHGHVDGIEEVQIKEGLAEVHVPVDYDPYEMDDELHPHDDMYKETDDKKEDRK